MRNKRGGVLGTVGVFLFALLLVYLTIGIIVSLIEDYNEYKEYKEFCEEREDFCFCGGLECEFKAQWSSESGLSENTRELCELAKRFGDKKTMFKIGCEQ